LAAFSICRFKLSGKEIVVFAMSPYNVLRNAANFSANRAGS
jgi:hypothetical protein